jgi:photosystem II stability/assembly factor-like uncharacterized protein
MRDSRQQQSRPARRGIHAPLLLLIALASIPSKAPAAIFGLIDTGELYSSTNAGVTWAILSTLSVRDAVGLAAGSSTSDLFIVTRSGSVYHSSNAGAAWSASGAITASDVVSFTIYSQTGNPPISAVVALTESGTLFRSMDGGVTFSGLAVLTGSNFVAITRGPLGRLYALTRTGEVYESQNQGAAWSAVGSIPVSNAVSIRRRVSELYVLVETGELYRSIDYGRTWIPVAAITASNMSAILDVGSALVATAKSGEVYSSSTGTSWTAIGAIQQLQVMSLGADTPLATGVDVDETPPAVVEAVPCPNPTTRAVGSRIVFTTSGPDRVRFELFDVRGRRVAELGPIPFSSAGRHDVQWRPADLAAGVYHVRMTMETGRSSSFKWSVLK